MENSLKIVLVVLALIPLSKGNPLVPQNQSIICGDWISYNNEKCLNMLKTAGPMKQDEAENACRSLQRGKSFARLVSVKTSQQEDFLHQFLYENDISESIWLGLKENQKTLQFEWSDGSELVFSNLMKANVTGSPQQCVEMNEAGLWITVNCTKKNIVVCEREPIWRMGGLQNEHPHRIPTEQGRKGIKSEKDCDEKTDILKEATDKTMDLLKEAKEKIADLEQSEDPNQGGTTKSSLCGDWTAYKDEKCVKVADEVGTQSREDAEMVCRSFGSDSEQSVPKVVTIKSKEEHEFLHEFLFKESKLVDNVWLGLSKNSKKSLFEWNDGSKLTFTHWSNQNVSGDSHRCVQMVSGDGFLAAGLWVRVSCERKNAVLCERRPVWTLETLQNSFMNFKLEQNMKQKELEEKLVKSETTLMTKIVPIGFIYVELPNQPSPSTLWPATQWTDVSSNYSGLFFRVVGDQAAPFGQIQDGNSPRLAEVERINSYKSDKVGLPSDGSWSDQVFTGSHDSTKYQSLRFRLSVSEVRPRNQAVRIWKRIQ